MWKDTERIHMQTTSYKLKANLNKPYRIALAADLHNAPCDRLLKDIEAQKPDIITVAGDIVFSKALERAGFDYEPGTPMLERFPNAVRFVRGIAEIAPAYFSFGNHEWLLNPVDVQMISDAGVTVLHNSWVKQGEFVIGGMSSPLSWKFWEFTKKWHEEHPDDRRGSIRQEYFNMNSEEYYESVDASWLPDFEAQEGYKLLICHHPEYWAIKEPGLESHKIDLVVAGHAHGGQIRLFGHGVFAPYQGFWPKYTSGVHDGDFGKLVISRGLSNPVPVPRLFNPCEMVYVELE